MTVIGFFNYLATIFLFLFGIFIVIAARNLLKKVIGMTLMQTGVILFFISLAYKHHSKMPILDHHAGLHAISPDHFANPLPHALMLTAIVVSVSLLGVSLVLIIDIFRETASMEEDEILEKLETNP